MNFSCFTDWWQLGPVKATAIFSNPFEASPGIDQRILKMFWAGPTDDPDGLNAMVELTEAKRCKDQWLLAFIQECRHGKQTEEM